MKLDHFAIGAILVLLHSAGCETPGLARTTAAQCMNQQQQQSRDECYFDLVSEASENQDLETCMQQMFQIQDPLLRSAAVRMLISRQPQGMDQILAQNLCGQLPETESEECLRVWDRAHLWDPR